MFTADQENVEVPVHVKVFFNISPRSIVVVTITCTTFDFHSMHVYLWQVRRDGKKKQGDTLRAGAAAWH